MAGPHLCENICVKVGAPQGAGRLIHPGVVPGKVFDHTSQGHIVEAPMLTQVLHVPIPAAVKGAVNGVVHPIELQWQQAEFLAQA
jgi:hypothetical protein